MASRALRPLAASLALTLGLALSSPAAEEPLPRVRAENREYLGNALSRPFLGEIPGEGEAFFKPDAAAGRHLDRGNLEAEVLTSTLLRRLDLPALGSRAVTVRAQWRSGQFLSRRHLQSELLGPGLVGGQPLVLQAELPWHQLPEVEWREVIRLGLLDVVIGNGDRHKRNLMFRQDARGRWRPFAIDHNLAFVTRQVSRGGYLHYNFVPGFDGAPADAIVLRNESFDRAAAGTPEQILGRNRLYERIFDAARRDPNLAALVLEEARFLRRALSDGYVDWAVAELREGEITARDPAKRRQELREVLRVRRDLLLEWVSRELPEATRGDPGAVGRDLGRELPEDVREALRQHRFTENQRVLLTSLLQPGPEAVANANSLFALLRATGVPPELSARVVEAVTRRPAAEVVDPRTLREVERALESRAASPRPLPPSGGPRRGFQVEARNGALEVRDLRGSSVSLAAFEALQETLEPVAARHTLAPGERWLFLPDTTPGQEPRFRVVRVDATGAHHRLEAAPPAPAVLRRRSSEVLGWDGLEIDPLPAREPLRPEQLHHVAEELRRRAGALGSSGRIEEGRALWELSREAARLATAPAGERAAPLRALEGRLPETLETRARARVREEARRIVEEARTRRALPSKRTKRPLPRRRGR